MWPFPKKLTLRSSGVFGGFTDCHSHILPGVDDGVRTMEESLAILKRYEELGVRTVWLTPHIMEDVPNTPADLRSRFEALRGAYDGGLTLRLGAENMIDNLFVERLEAGDLLTMGGDGRHLLVETSYFTPPYRFEEILKDVMSKGLRPVLAHPERYVYMGRGDYERLKALGIRFQLNLFSLAGYYGPEARKKATALLSKGFYEYAGSDIHRISALDASLDVRIDPKVLPSFEEL